MYKGKLSKKEYELIQDQYNSYIEQNALPKQVSDYIFLLYDHIERQKELKKEEEEFAEGLFEQFWELTEKVVSLSEGYVIEGNKTPDEVIEVINSQVERIKDDHKVLMDMYLTEKGKLSKGGRAGRKYNDHVEEIKLALSKHLDSTKEKPFTLASVAEYIANTIADKTGNEYKEPSENQISKWKKVFVASKRQSIYE